MQTIDEEDFQPMYNDKQKSPSFYSNDDMPCSQDAYGFSRTTKFALFITVLLVVIVHWKCEFLFFPLQLL